ncbi:MAG: hypothetical protein JW914_03830 [Syntrophaceae bacterium]|nr:hypothetical protein [Syntrophaceae bacterium]
MSEYSKMVIPAKAGIQALSSLRMRGLSVRQETSFNIPGCRIKSGMTILL